jgi:hypothetical protein
MATSWPDGKQQSGVKLRAAFHSKSINWKITRNEPIKICLNESPATVKSIIIVHKDAAYGLNICHSSNAVFMQKASATVLLMLSA